MTLNLIGTKLAEDVYVGDPVLYDDSFYLVSHINIEVLQGRRKIVLFENGRLTLGRSDSVRYPLPDKLTTIDFLTDIVRKGMERFKGVHLSSREYAAFIQQQIDIIYP